VAMYYTHCCGFVFYLYPISLDNPIFFFGKASSSKCYLFPSSLYNVDYEINKFFDLYLTFPSAIILPNLTGLIMLVLNDAVRTNTSSTIEFTAKKCRII